MSKSDNKRCLGTATRLTWFQKYPEHSSIEKIWGSNFALENILRNFVQKMWETKQTVIIVLFYLFKFHELLTNFERENIKRWQTRCWKIFEIYQFRERLKHKMKKGVKTIMWGRIHSLVIFSKIYNENKIVRRSPTQN